MVALFLIGACGDNVRGIELEDLDASRREAQCERLVRCGVFEEHSTCVAYFRASVDVSLIPLVDAGKLRYDPTAAAACNRAVAEQGCDLTLAEARTLPESCERVLIGNVASGDTCTADRECATGRCDAPICPRDACCPGGCEAYVTPAALGATCDPAVGCVDGSFCGREKTCRLISKVSEPCELDKHCASGLACIGATELESGACRALPKLGEQCPYQRCAELGARCDGQICVSFGAVGDACLVSSDCSEFRLCDPNTQRCIDKPTLGMACIESCRGESWCDFAAGPMGTCRAPLPVAAPCGASDECASRFCEEGPIFDQCATPAICI